jgi:hypothetical protein
MYQSCRQRPGGSETYSICAIGSSVKQLWQLNIDCVELHGLVIMEQWFYNLINYGNELCNIYR